MPRATSARISPKGEHEAPENGLPREKTGPIGGPPSENRQHPLHRQCVVRFHYAFFNGLLSIKIAGVELPQVIKDAIAEGTPVKTQVGKTAVEVKRDNWPTGKGYELHVIFK